MQKGMTEKTPILLNNPFVRALLPKRDPQGHKGTFGKAAIVGGSVEYTGAPYLSATACMRAGAGYVTLFVPDELLPYYMLKSPELLLRGISAGERFRFLEERMEALLSYDAVAYGMGMGISEEVYTGAKWLLTRYRGRLLLDADALNGLAKYGGEELTDLLRRATCSVVLTPHPKEFARLLGRTTDEVSRDGAPLAYAFAKATGATVLLKGATSRIAYGDGAFVNERGNSGQAKAGTGDVLSGVIAGLLAQQSQAAYAAAAGAYLTGVAAELAARDLGEYSLLPSDLVAYLGRAFLFVAEHADENGGRE